MNRQPRFPPRARSAEVAERIRTAILERSFAAGEALPSERELASEFDVSRATVREALKQLQAQGLLGTRGARTAPMQAAQPEDVHAHLREALALVVRIRDVSLADLLELRMAVEIAAMPRSAARGSEHLDAARAALARMERPELSPDEFYDADVEYHRTLVAASGNQALELVMDALKDSIRLHLDRAMQARSSTKVRPRAIAEHRALLRAIERGNVKSAQALLRAHVGEFYGS